MTNQQIHFSNNSIDKHVNNFINKNNLKAQIKI